jgi:hypothetical protein
MAKKRIEGYWYSEENTRYPRPVKNILTSKQAQVIYDRLMIIQNHKNTTCVHYKGCSKSRIDNSELGSGEYSTDKWIWPEGFVDHYVLKYHVKPSDDFLYYIGVELNGGDARVIEDKK